MEEDPHPRSSVFIGGSIREDRPEVPPQADRQGRLQKNLCALCAFVVELSSAPPFIGGRRPPPTSETSQRQIERYSQRMVADAKNFAPGVDNETRLDNRPKTFAQTVHRPAV